MNENKKYIAPDIEVVLLEGEDIITSSRWDLPGIGFGSYNSGTDVESDW